LTGAITAAWQSVSSNLSKNFILFYSMLFFLYESFQSSLSSTTKKILTGAITAAWQSVSSNLSKNFILFYFIYFYFILFYCILFYFIMLSIFV